MFGWTPRDPSRRPEPEARPLRYRAEVRNRESGHGGDLHLYDGGDFSPYCIESLLELLRCEARAPHQALDLTFELLGPCSTLRLQEIANRFASASIAGLRVTVRATGHSPVRVGESLPAARPSSQPAPHTGSS